MVPLQPHASKPLSEEKVAELLSKPFSTSVNNGGLNANNSLNYWVIFHRQTTIFGKRKSMKKVT